MRVTSRSLPLYKVQQQRPNVNVSVRGRQPIFRPVSVARIRVHASPVRHCRIPAASLPVKGGYRIGGGVARQNYHIVPSTIGGVLRGVKTLSRNSTCSNLLLLFFGCVLPLIITNLAVRGDDVLKNNVVLTSCQYCPGQ